LRLAIDTSKYLATLTLANPKKANPLSFDLMDQMLLALKEIDGKRDVRVVLLQHEGSYFSSGHDLDDLFDRSAGWAARSEEARRRVFSKCSELSLCLRSLRQPTVAAVHGHASSGGLQLAAFCDLLVAGTGAQFSIPGSRRGRFCHMPAVALAERVPQSKALSMALLGTVLSAQEAERFGLVDVLAASDHFEEEVSRVVERMAEASPLNIALGKACFYGHRGIGSEALSAKLKAAEDAMVASFATRDAAEGTIALFEKRPPVFIGE